MSLQIFGIIFTISQGKIMDKWGALAGNIFLCIFLLIGTVMTGEVLASLLLFSLGFLCCKTMNFSHLSAADRQARDLKGNCDTPCFRSPRQDSLTSLLTHVKFCYTAQDFPLVARRVTVNRCLQFPKILVTYWMKLVSKKDI